MDSGFWRILDLTETVRSEAARDEVHSLGEGEASVHDVRLGQVKEGDFLRHLEWVSALPREKVQCKVRRSVSGLLNITHAQ